MLATDKVNVPDPSLFNVPAPEPMAAVLTVVLPSPPNVSPIVLLVIPPVNVNVPLSLSILTALVDKAIAPA